jgi:inhibitor of KinA sporulation pathway (predicted exonuclease)
MIVREDKLVVIDVEATCWEPHPPAGQQSEIIEVGVCLLDLRTRQVGGGESILVRPTRSQVSAFCTRLTTLTQAMLDAEGIAFAEACRTLAETYQTGERIWASWGNYDRTIFTRQCESSGIPYPFSSRHLNLKAVFGELYQLKKKVGMARALSILGLPQEGIHHRGVDDARNIARIAAALIGVHGRRRITGLDGE